VAQPSLFTPLAMALLRADLSDMPTVQARVLFAIADIVCAAAKRYGARAHRLDGVWAGTRRAPQSQ